ncbi:MAG: DUF262 domain-containing protein [Acidimicrobiia bacterium]|nr:DUF262 domain-containing protein [Acidimicrobiia bacterium]MYG72190.1 DUF262 domain-containing protein [Acidimicrobiia bacterium]
MGNASSESKISTAKTVDNSLEEDHFESIPSEVADQEVSLPAYDILTYPADYTLEVIVSKWKKGEIISPNFQRNFVWSLNRASRLIESFLLGLPVPSIFLFSDQSTNSLIIVDGQQRLQSIVYFFEGVFGEEVNGNRQVFRLAGLSDDSKFRGLTYDEIRQQYPKAYHTLTNSILRSMIIRQLHPEDSTSMFSIFERLNTGGVALAQQEIRNCIYHGTFNDMLVRLNRFEPWRKIYGREPVDKRQRDVELILRFFALREAESHQGLTYKKPMKNFLNRFMTSQLSISEESVETMSDDFRRTCDVVMNVLGEKPFRLKAGLNAAIFDCIFVTMSNNLDGDFSGFRDDYLALLSNTEFADCVRSETTDERVVSRRFELASNLFK